jgi:Cof subfamily protein (haloacid dehalogenase superfamily)
LQDVKLIATDMDHTLLTEAGELPPAFGATLDALAAQDIQFAIASGRPLYTLKALFPEHQDQLVLICDNGAVIADRGEIIAKHLLPQATLLDICATVTQATNGHPLICGLDQAIGASADQRFDSVFREFYHQLAYIDDLQAFQGEADKVTIYLPDGNAEEVFDQLIQPGYGDDYSAAVAGPVWIDIMPKNVNKGTAMAQIGKRQGISASQMMAFGDTFNDAQMLSYVKYGYLVANANPGMTPYAQYRTASNDDYGVVQVLNQVLATRA